MEILKAKESDINGILSLYAQEGWDKGNLIDFDKLPETCYLLVAKENEKVIATAQLDIIQTLAFGNQPYGVIEFVVTDKDYRRQGIMRKMFEEIDRIAIENNCESVMLTSSLPRIEAHLFYEEMGYVAPVRGFRKEYPEKAITKREANKRRYKIENC